TACDDGVVRVWPAAGGPAAELHGHTGRVKDVAVTPDGRTLVSAAMDHTARVWDVASRTTRHVLPHSDPVAAVAISADGTAIPAAGTSLAVWDVAPGRPAADPIQHESVVTTVRAGPGGRWLVSASPLRIRVWEPAAAGPGWRPRALLPGIPGHVGDLAFGPDG